MSEIKYQFNHRGLNIEHREFSVPSVVKKIYTHTHTHSQN